MPKTFVVSPTLALLLVAILDACASRHPAEVVRRFHASEANQAVAVDTNFFYAIDGAAIGKYDKRSGARVGGWNDSSGKITHLDSGVVVGDELYCAHSNYPDTPMVSSLEVFETDRLAHIRSIPLPQGIGSATWVERGNDGGGSRLRITPAREANRGRDRKPRSWCGSIATGSRRNGGRFQQQWCSSGTA